MSVCADGSSHPFSKKQPNQKTSVNKVTTIVTGMKFLQKAAFNGKRLSKIKNSSHHFKSQECEMSFIDNCIFQLLQLSLESPSDMIIFLIFIVNGRVYKHEF